MNYKIATKEDIHILCMFRKQQLIDNGAVFPEGFDAHLENFFKKCFNEDSIYQIIAYDNDKVVATGGILYFVYPPSHVNLTGKIAYVTNMYTLPAYRKQGIATHILELLEAEAKAQGISTSKLASSPSGRQVYKNNGYNEDHLVNMSKKL